MLSDGTLRVLAIAAALYSVPEGALVVIEEIDNGVHPSRAQMLINKIQEVIKQRSLHVLLTTHNPALLDALPLELYRDVIYCYRDSSEGDSRFIRLTEIPNYPYLMMQGTLGELLSKQLLEKEIHKPQSPEEQKEQHLRWLEDWKKG